MKSIINIIPFTDELPSHYADRLGVYYTSTVNNDHKKENGQYFTPVQIADFMGSMSNLDKKDIRILDPGAGTSILSCALIENIIKKINLLKKIELVVYETDTMLIPYTCMVLDYLKTWSEKFGITLITILKSEDFILANKDCFHKQTLFQNMHQEQFDIIISNPPYFKLNKEDKRAIVAKSIAYGQPNIYSIFMIIAAKLLKNNGEFIFITPRSFTSGNYFRAFRENFFLEVQIENIHLFGSRKDTFNRDSVLQELLIVKARKKYINGFNPLISVTYSQGIKDLNNPTKKEYYTNELIDFNSKEKIMHLPVSLTDEKVMKLFKSWTGSLNQYNIQISTGPVVSFRAKEFLHEKDLKDVKLIPLYQLHNTTKMTFEWPIERPNKPQYIELCDETKNLIIPNKNYIFLRRFSSKDDKSRLVATPYFIDIAHSEFIGVENHLNYIYRPNGHLERNEILGLSALLNSTVFDTYFRTFNGNINVSATELREMPLPPLHEIKEIGNEIILKNNFSQAIADEAINKYFELEQIFENHEQN